MHMRALEDGRLVYVTADPSFGVLDGARRKVFEHRSGVSDFRGLGDGFLVSADGTAVQFAFESGGGAPARFAVRTRRLDRDPTPSGDLSPPLHEAPGVEVRDWENDLKDWGTRRHPTLDGRPLPLLDHETSVSLALVPGGDGLVLGTNWRVVRYDRQGRPVWSRRVPAEALAVHVPTDGRLALAALSDGTIRWFRLADGTELVALFAHPDGKRWVAWTPGGYYMASPSGDELMGWHVNNDGAREADFFPASRLRERFYRPEVVAAILDTLDETEALRKVGLDRPGENRSRGALAAALPPVLTLHAPTDGAVLAENPVEFRYSLRGTDRAGPVGLKVLADGRPLHRFADEPPPDPEGRERRRAILIPDRDADIALVAETADAVSMPATTRLRRPVSRPDDTPLRLRVLAIGVGDYRKPELRLAYPAKDARDFAAALAAQGGRAYAAVERRLLADGEVTLAAVRDGLAWLKREADESVVTVLFLAGHGVDDPTGRYFFVPADGDPEDLARTALPYEEIRQALAETRGRALLFVDTCHAGDVLGRPGRPATDATRVANDLASHEYGVAVFTSSTGEQVSLESSAWGNGAFTKAVVEGLTGGADLFHRGYATASMLQVYVAERVRDLTGGAQTPAYAVPRLVPDFTLARF
jgi:hypothetical protein